MASNEYTLTNMNEVVSRLDTKGFTSEVPRSILLKTIAEVTNLAHPLAMKQFLKGMNDIGMIAPISTGSIWKIITEQED